MPKKKKKGKADGAEREKKSKKKPWLNERETVAFEQQILDNNRQLARLRSRNDELEEEAKLMKIKYQELEEDRADVIAHLERVLNERTKEAKELNERLLALEELRKEELDACKKKEEQMENDYRLMESNLNAEIKLATGKLSSLEEWRLARIDLQKKFEIQETQMAEQEKRHKETLYEAEKALIIGKARMQKEMEERLNELAKKFREATNIRIADASHRAIRENIALNHELDAMLKACRELEERTHECEERDRFLKLQMQLAENEAKIAMRKTLKQNETIEKLAQEHFDMIVIYDQMKRAETYTNHMENVVQIYKDKYKDALTKRDTLEQHIRLAQAERKEMLNRVRKNCKRVAKLEKTLHHAKICIARALHLQRNKVDMGEAVCMSCFPETKEDLLLTLLNILTSKGDNLEIDGSDKYSYGSLGLLVQEASSVSEISGESQDLESGRRRDSEEVIKIEELDREGSQTAEKLINEQIESTPECLKRTSDSSDISSPRDTLSAESSCKEEDEEEEGKENK